MSAKSKGLVLITGASAGLGAAFAKAYAARGYDLALAARRVDRLDALAAELTSAHGIEAFSIGVDLGVYEAEKAVLDAVAARGLHIDILVNNAGFSIPQSYAAVPWERQRDFLMTMVVSACGLAYAVIPGMVERGGGAIINIASLAGFAPGMAGHTLYPAGKSFLIKFSEALHEEYSAKGVRVTAVCPGFTHTEFALANGTVVVQQLAQLFHRVAHVCSQHVFTIKLMVHLTHRTLQKGNATRVARTMPRVRAVFRVVQQGFEKGWLDAF